MLWVNSQFVPIFSFQHWQKALVGFPPLPPPVSFYSLHILMKNILAAKVSLLAKTLIKLIINGNLNKSLF